MLLSSKAEIDTAIIEIRMYEDLEPIARLKFGKEMEAISKQTLANVQKARAEYAALGAVGRSGQHEAAIARMRISGTEHIGRALFRIWVDLITRRNGRIVRDDISFILEKLKEFTNAQTINLSSTMNGQLGIVLPSLAEEARMRMDALVTTSGRDLEIMVREQEAFPERAAVTREPTIQLNIQNSSIANLNLGSQLGTINAALQSISGQEGQQELAQALKQLTEAVLSNANLPGSEKQEVVQALSTIAEQAEKKPENRSAGTLKAVVAWLPTILSTAADLTALWDKYVPVIRAYFLI